MKVEKKIKKLLAKKYKTNPKIRTYAIFLGHSASSRGQLILRCSLAALRSNLPQGSRPRLCPVFSPFTVQNSQFPLRSNRGESRPIRQKKNAS
jgi:hypothetical protein